MWENKQYDGEAADLFAAGMILHIMVRGLPFMTARYGVDREYTAFVTRANTPRSLSALDDLLDHMLTNDLSKRYTLDQILNHAWVCQPGIDADEKISYLAERVTYTN
jgi:serine/threonine protein kinase